MLRFLFSEILAHYFNLFLNQQMIDLTSVISSTLRVERLLTILKNHSKIAKFLLNRVASQILSEKRASLTSQYLSAAFWLTKVRLAPPPLPESQGTPGA